jgi:hypothetical protein
MSALQELKVRSVKILDMGYVAIIYFVIGLLLSKASDAVFGKYDAIREKSKSTIRLGLEVLLMLWVICIVMYVARNVVELVPSPFDGVFGFQHARLKELNGVAILIFTYLFFQDTLRAKMTELYNRF